MHAKPIAIEQLSVRVRRQTATARALRAALPQLQRQFDRLGRLDALFEQLWARRSIAFERLDTIGDLVRLAALAGRLDEALAEFERQSAAGALHDLRWDSNFAPGWLRPIDDGFADTLLRMKYRGIPLEAGERARALQLICPRMIIDPPLMTALHAMRTDVQRPRGSWNAALREAFALDHLIHDTLDAGLPIDAAEFLEAGAIRDLAASAGAEPALILIFHGGFIPMLKLVYELAFPTGYRLQSTPALDARQISTRTDRSAALFAALRAMRDGHSLMMAPDYWIGESDLSIEIAGQRHAVAAGAPFLAYETGCRVWWFDLARAGARFRPRLTEMIRRSPGEAFERFSARFYEAYSAMIDGVLRGPPENIVLRHRWARFIADGAAAKAAMAQSAGS